MTSTFQDSQAPNEAAQQAARRPSPGRRVAALGEVFLCSGLPTQLAIATSLGALGLRPLTPEGGLSRTFVVVLSLTDTAALLLLMIWLIRENGERPKDVWLGAARPAREAVVGLLYVPALVVGVGLLLTSIRALAPQLQNVPTNPLEALADSPSGAAMLALVAILAGGVREELQRAFLLRRMSVYLGGPAVAVVVLSLAFGLGHYVQGWDAAITTGVMGLFWAVLYLARRSSVAPVVSHAAFNLVEIVRVALTGAS